MLLSTIAFLFFFLVLAGLAWLATTFILHFFVPKNMLHMYFREPYFSPFEVEFFSGFPFAYMRTVMFMRLAAWPNSGKKRGLTDAHKLAPRWFQIISKFMVVSLVTIYPTIVVISIWAAIAL